MGRGPLQRVGTICERTTAGATLMFDFLGGLGLLANWRLLAGKLITIAICLLIIFGVPSEVPRLLLCAPVLILGVFLSYRWENRGRREN